MVRFFANGLETLCNRPRSLFYYEVWQKGYFSYDRGVRQGDTLSPSLFCLEEDYLSRSLSLLVQRGDFTHIREGGSLVPSPFLYADDILIFKTASRRNIRAIVEVFHQHGMVSGQEVRQKKLQIFFGPEISAGKRQIFTGL